MLTEKDLESLRTTMNRSLPGTAVITSPTFTEDGMGGGTASFSVAGTVDCRVEPIGGREFEVADRISSEADWIITFPALTDVATEDRVVTNGGTFAVVAVRGPRTFEVSRRVEARQL